MSTIANRSAVPQTIVVQVVAIKNLDGKGYTMRSFPERVVVNSNNTVLVFQLVDPTQSGVVFLPPTIEPQPQDQFSTVAISRDGKLLLLSDLNSVTGIFHLYLHVRDAEGNLGSHDPEVINRPDTVD